MLKKLLFILCSLFSISSFSQITVEGRITDSLSGEVIPFVNVLVENKSFGTTSDMDGKYNLFISTPDATLIFSSIGYETKRIKFIKSNGDTDKFTRNIQLKKANYLLREAVIMAGENPALRIIRKVIENREFNDPVRMNAYTCETYNKFKYYLELDSSVTPKNKKADTSEIRFRNFLDSSYVFLMETITQKKFMKPDHHKEIITAVKASGFQDPGFALLSTEIQPFSFYDEYLTLAQQTYLSPISKAGLGRYSYSLQDTTWGGKDTVYIISFKPAHGMAFDGLKGTLYINSNGYAIQNVLTQPEREKPGDRLRIQQKYEYVNGTHWFPVQLLTEITFAGLNKDLKMFASGKTYISHIDFNPALKYSDFDEVMLEFSDTIDRTNFQYLISQRPDTLTPKEIHTYQTIDSLSAKYKLEKKVKRIEWIFTGKIPVAFIDIEPLQILKANVYEGFAPKLGFHTNNKMSKYLKVGGYGAYGFKDKSPKFGADLRISPWPLKDYAVTVSYIDDLGESGGVQLLNSSTYVINANLRSLFVSRFDRWQKVETGLELRMLRYLQTRIYFSSSQIKPMYDYRYLGGGNDFSSSLNLYKLTTSGLMFRYAYKEIFTRMMNMKMAEPSEFPVLSLNYLRGLKNIYDGNFEFNRVDFAIDFSLKIARFGKSDVRVQSGWIDRGLPYFANYNALSMGDKIFPSFRYLGLYEENSFQTMATNEFISQKYVAFFWKHKLGHLIFSSGRFRPVFYLATNFLTGSFSGKTNHEGLILKTPEKTFMESGFLLGNILHQAFSSYGIGFFYRYGAYAESKPINNFVAKLSFVYAL